MGFSPGSHRMSFYAGGASMVLLCLASCTEPHWHQLAISEILFIGNSITLATPDPTRGWQGDWGMAATDSSRDYVHQFAAKFPGANHRQVNIAAFETDFRTFDLESLDYLLAKRPSLVVIELGDNVSASPDEFAPYFAGLVTYVSARTNAPILCTSTWWARVFINLAIQAGCSQPHTQYVNISGIETKPANRANADEDYRDPRTGEHPSDKGMALIADALYRALGP